MTTTSSRSDGEDNNGDGQVDEGFEDVDQDNMTICVDDCPNDPINDPDNDEACAAEDNCAILSTSSQMDTDSDGQGDACETTPIVGNLLTTEGTLPTRLLWIPRLAFQTSKRTGGQSESDAALTGRRRVPMSATRLLDDLILRKAGLQHPLYSSVLRQHPRRSPQCLAWAKRALPKSNNPPSTNASKAWSTLSSRRTFSNWIG
ncbi:MAG: hypothetical protein GY822_20565 [Deltaproteobacteria bacterium]|nr:hypothetical protein [Deltaproteobacteria bacterium]